MILGWLRRRREAKEKEALKIRAMNELSQKLRESRERIQARRQRDADACAARLRDHEAAVQVQRQQEDQFMTGMLVGSMLQSSQSYSEPAPSAPSCDDDYSSSYNSGSDCSSSSSSSSSDCGSSYDSGSSFDSGSSSCGGGGSDF